MHKQRYDPAIHHRRTMRLPAYDYSSNGAYFVTICLQEREPLLMNPELHKILEDTQNTLPQRFPSVMLDDFIIMSDHVHFIIWLTPYEGSCSRLGDVVGAYKSLTGRTPLRYLRMERQVHTNQFWQRDYYEHVMRNEFELQEKREYIRNNPIKEDLKRNRL